MSTDLNSLLIGTSELSKKITNDNNSMINLNNDINLNILLIEHRKTSPFRERI